MRAVLAVVAMCLVTCSSPELSDGDIESMEVLEHRLEAPTPPPFAQPDASSFSHSDTFDCYGGGEVKVSITWSNKEEPYSKKYYVSWEYSACDTFFHGTIDGKVNYSKNKDEKCTNSSSFVDSRGLTCEDWRGYNCHNAVEEWGFSEEEEKRIKENCPEACNACYWFTGVHYYADLDYTDASISNCSAYMTMTKKSEDMIGDLEIKDHCKHPVREWWGRMGL